MKTKARLPIALSIGIAATLSGCARENCVRRHFQTAWVEENGFGPGFLVAMCKGGRSPGRVFLTLPSSGQVALDTVYTHDRESRYDGSCSDDYTKRDTHEEAPVALTSLDFDTKKLCYLDSSRAKFHLIPKAQSCPPGTTEQPAPIDDCTTM